ncbi:hypothetical protein FRB94_013642 [Tulasnella sp. JGI-2019a]|nr:hypothetical protein FRB94_013642 [Tulasnella sp. JGI-2019a]
MGVYRGSVHNARATPGTRSGGRFGRLYTPIPAAALPTIHAPSVETPIPPLTTSATATSPNFPSAATIVEGPHAYSPNIDAKLDSAVTSVSVIAPNFAPALSNIQVFARRHLLESKTITVVIGPKSPEVYMAGACRLIKTHDGTTIGMLREGTALCQLIESALQLRDSLPSFSAMTEASVLTVPVGPTLLSIGKRSRAKYEVPAVVEKKARSTTPPTNIQVVTTGVPTDATTNPVSTVSIKSVSTTQILQTFDTAPHVTLAAPTINDPSASSPPNTTGKQPGRLEPKAAVGAPAVQRENLSGPDCHPPVAETNVQTHHQNETPVLVVEDNGGIIQLTDMARTLSLQHAKEPESADQAAENSLATAEATESVGESAFDLAGIEVVWEEESNGEMPELEVVDNSAIHQVTDMMRALSLHPAEEPESADRTTETVNVSFPLTSKTAANDTIPAAESLPGVADAEDGIESPPIAAPVETEDGDEKRKRREDRGHTNRTRAPVVEDTQSVTGPSGAAVVENPPTAEAIAASAETEGEEKKRKRRGKRGHPKRKGVPAAEETQPVAGPSGAAGIEDTLATEAVATSGATEGTKKKRKNRSKKNRNAPLMPAEAGVSDLGAAIST